jgi:hypothetical protein
MTALTDEQLFTEWKKDANNRDVQREILRRQAAAVGAKCEVCGHTKSWTGPITSCGCIDWSD